MTANFAQLELNNQGNLYNNFGGLEWNGLRFRSYSETCIAEELERRNILFWPLAACRINGRTLEPDFLIQHPETRSLGILEVNGQPYHTPENSTRDHERSQEFFMQGITVQFFDANECRNSPERVIDRFLEIIRVR